MENITKPCTLENIIKMARTWGYQCALKGSSAIYTEGKILIEELGEAVQAGIRTEADAMKILDAYGEGVDMLITQLASDAETYDPIDPHDDDFYGSRPGEGGAHDYETNCPDYEPHPGLKEY